MEKHQHNTTQVVKILILTGIVTAWVTGCKNNSTSSETNRNKVAIMSTSAHGNVLTDGDGNVLYVFAPDVKGDSKCEGGCIANWPVYNADQVQAGAGLQASAFGQITRSDGSMQVTYKGWPLYYFVGDKQAGDINGDGVNSTWFVASPDYTLMIASGQLVGADGKTYKSDYTQGDGTTLYFTDSHGRTLYIFNHDSKDTNNFTKSDFSNDSFWPIYYEEINTLPSGMNKQDFGEIMVYGKQQLTYRGWPVYYFGQDAMRGDTKGVSVPQPGVWPILNGDTPVAP